jgi:transcriptional regulator
MYIPQHFQESRQPELHRLIEAHPLGALVMCTPDGLDANHLPWLLDVREGQPTVLQGHVARANRVWQDCPDGTEALVIFRAEQDYISPNWYPSKHETHRQVPTWNYQVVHVHGRFRIRDDNKFVRGVVARLTRVHEGRTGAAAPWKMSDSSKEYIDSMVSAIVGIEIEVDTMVGKFKLSQNREERDRVAAAQELRERGSVGLSDAMLGAR